MFTLLCDYNLSAIHLVLPNKGVVDLLWWKIWIIVSKLPLLLSVSSAC